MHATQTYVKMALPTAVYTERYSATRTTTSRGKGAPRDVVDVESTHRTRAPTSGTPHRRRWTSLCTRPRRASSTSPAHNLPARRERAGRAAHVSARSADGRYGGRRRTASAAAGACTCEGERAAKCGACASLARAPSGCAADLRAAASSREPVAAAAPGRSAAPASKSAAGDVNLQQFVPPPWCSGPTR